MKKRVVIIDDHPLFREGLKSVIDRSNNFELIGESGYAREGFEIANEVQPDVVIIDISLPDQSGIELTKRICATIPQSRVLIVSMHNKADYVAQALQAGSKGYVLKGSPSEKLLQAITAVGKDEFYIDSALSGEVAKKLIESPAQEKTISDNSYQTLTPREQEIMRSLVEGVRPKEIARTLCISTKTVENHRTNIMNKLGLDSMVDLIRYATRIGLIDLDTWKS